MKDRIKFMYEGGSASLLEILFSSEDMGDFLNRAEYVTVISDYDREMLDEFQEARLEVEKKENALEDKQKDLKALQNNLSSQQDAINSKISSTSGELADYQKQLDRARAAEAVSYTHLSSCSGTVLSGYDGDVHRRIKLAGSSSLAAFCVRSAAASYCQACYHSNCCHHCNKLFHFHLITLLLICVLVFEVLFSSSQAIL